MLLGACSSSNSPQLIAVQPADEAIAIYPQSQPPTDEVVLNATMDLEVSQVDHAASRAQEIAFDHGGYLVKAQSWYQDGEKHTMLILSLPADNFESVHVELLRLGTLVSESISGDLVEGDGARWKLYSHITVYLRPRSWATPDFSIGKPRPLVTLTKAWNVFLWIFGFILDVLIWLVVIVGPFLLIGWVCFALIRHRHKKRKQDQ
jgi:hypothetical protein